LHVYCAFWGFGFEPALKNSNLKTYALTLRSKRNCEFVSHEIFYESVES
jgi:hypothetical protein